MCQFFSSTELGGRQWKDNEKRINKIVFIGKELKRQELEDGFRACLL
jgi:G3E family GTPase